jgi:hypothetical protein
MLSFQGLYTFALCSLTSFKRSDGWTYVYKVRPMLFGLALPVISVLISLEFKIQSYREYLTMGYSPYPFRLAEPIHCARCIPLAFFTVGLSACLGIERLRTVPDT